MDGTQMLRCEHSFCGYEIEWATAIKPEHADLLKPNGCPESAGTMQMVFTDAQRLSMVRHMLRNVVVPFGDGHVTVWDRLVDLRIPLHSLLRDVKPLSSDCYSPMQFSAMIWSMSHEL